MNKNTQERLKKAAENHRANIQSSLQHRLEVAQAKGDQILVRQLQAEFDYYK